MRHNSTIISISALVVASLTSAHAQFTAGDLVVLQDGTGSAALTSAGTAINLDEFTTLGAAAFSVAIPSTGSSELVNSGTATSEGEISLSANDQYIVVSGYNAPAGTPSIANTASSADPRGVATVDASGNYSLAGTTSSLFSANNIRSGTTDGNGNFWAVGANSGVVDMAPGTPAAISSTSANNRLVQDMAAISSSRQDRVPPAESTKSPAHRPAGPIPL
jgi:hypothetical protein